MEADFGQKCMEYFRTQEALGLDLLVPWAAVVSSRLQEVSSRLQEDLAAALPPSLREVGTALPPSLAPVLAAAHAHVTTDAKATYPAFLLYGNAIKSAIDYTKDHGSPFSFLTFSSNTSRTRSWPFNIATLRVDPLELFTGVIASFALYSQATHLLMNYFAFGKARDAPPNLHDDYELLYFPLLGNAACFVLVTLVAAAAAGDDCSGNEESKSSKFARFLFRTTILPLVTFAQNMDTATTSMGFVEEKFLEMNKDDPPGGAGGSSASAGSQINKPLRANGALFCWFIGVLGLMAGSFARRALYSQTKGGARARGGTSTTTSESISKGKGNDDAASSGNKQSQRQLYCWSADDEAGLRADLKLSAVFTTVQMLELMFLDSRFRYLFHILPYFYAYKKIMSEDPAGTATPAAATANAANKTSGEGRDEPPRPSVEKLTTSEGEVVVGLGMAATRRDFGDRILAEVYEHFKAQGKNATLDMRFINDGSGKIRIQELSRINSSYYRQDHSSFSSRGR